MSRKKVVAQERPRRAWEKVCDECPAGLGVVAHIIEKREHAFIDGRVVCVVGAVDRKQRSEPFQALREGFDLDVVCPDSAHYDCLTDPDVHLDCMCDKAFALRLARGLVHSNEIFMFRDDDPAIEPALRAWGERCRANRMHPPPMGKI